MPRANVQKTGAWHLYYLGASGTCDGLAVGFRKAQL